MDDQNRKPAISYPCQWDYKIIGRDAASIRQLVQEVLPGRAYTLDESHVSSGGKYCSLALAVEVRDQADRDGIFQALRENKDVAMVL